MLRLVRADRHWLWCRSVGLQAVKPTLFPSILNASLVFSICRAQRAAAVSTPQLSLHSFSASHGPRVTAKALDVIGVPSFHKSFFSTAFPAALVEAGAASSSYEHQQTFFYGPHVTIIAFGFKL